MRGHAVRTIREPDGGFVAIATGPEPWQRAIARHDDEHAAAARAHDALEEAITSGRVSPTLLDTRTPLPGEDLRDFLGWHDLVGHGFAYEELVHEDTRERFELPPRTLWANIVPTLALAYLLRAKMRELGARGLVVAAAYRPSRGEPNSRHKVFAALDLDLVAGDQRLAGTYLRTAAELYRDHADSLRMGCGSYHPPGSAWTRRVHIDTGTGGPRPRSWQHSGNRKVRPSAIDRLAGRD